MTRILLFMVGCVLINNFAFKNLLGPDSMGDDQNISIALMLGLSVAVTVSVASIVCWLVNSLVLKPLNVTALQLPVYMALIGLAVLAAEAVLEKRFPAIGRFSVLLAAGCALMGAEIMSFQGELVGAIISGLICGVGSMAAIVLMAGVQERIQFSHMPEAMKGLPITLVSAALMSLAFMGLMGIV